MEWLGSLFLYLHISGVIVAFGSTIAFPFLAVRAAKEPMHGNFVLRATEFISARVVEPGAVFIFLTGVGAIITRGWNPLEQFWLALAIVLFVITFTFANLRQAKWVKRMIELTSRPPVVADGDPERAGLPGLAGPGTPALAAATPAGPPPEFVELSKKAALGGQFMLAMVFIILGLMVFKPNF